MPQRQDRARVQPSDAAAWGQKMEQTLQRLEEKLAARDELFAFMEPVAAHSALMTLGGFINRFKVEVVRAADEHPPGTSEETLLAAWPGIYESVKGEGETSQASLQPHPSNFPHVHQVHVAALCMPSLAHMPDTYSVLVSGSPACNTRPPRTNVATRTLQL